MKPGILTEEKCRSRLLPHHDALYWCVANAHTRAQEALKLIKLQRPGASFRAQLTQELMVDNVRSQFGNSAGIEIIERTPRRRDPNDVVSERFFLQFGKPGPDAMICGFKKFDADFRTRNYPTRTAVAFNRQLELDNVPKGFRFAAGYQVNQEGELMAVAVVCQGELYPNWWYELEPADAGGEATTANPLQPARVRVKKPQLEMPDGKLTGK